MSVIAVVTAIPSELPQSGRAEQTVLPKLSSSDLFEHVVLAIADLPGANRVAEFAKRNNVHYVIGDAVDFKKRLAGVNNLQSAKLVARFQLRASWVDMRMVQEAIEAIQAAKADYVAYERNVNYAMSVDVFTTAALARVKQCGLYRSSTSDDQKVFDLYPWAAFEYSDEFSGVTISTNVRYSAAEAQKLRQLLSLQFGTEENQLGSGSPDNPASRYVNVAQFLNGNMRVADIACGKGGGTLYLGKYARTVEGFDIDEKYLASARKRGEGVSNVNFSGGGDKALSQRSCQFDAIVSLHTLEHVDDETAFLNTVFQALKPGGLFLLEVPKVFDFPLGVPLFPFHEREYSLNELTRLLSEVGFTILSTYGVDRHKYVGISYAREALFITAQK